MSDGRVPMTAEGHDAIKKELKHLKSVERPKVIQDIEEARALLEVPGGVNRITRNQLLRIGPGNLGICARGNGKIGGIRHGTSQDAIEASILSA